MRIWDLHLLRPWWLLALIPLIILAFFLGRQKPGLQGWGAVCDSHLLAHLIQSGGGKKRSFSLLSLVVGAVFMILAGAGPSWQKLPVPTYKPVQPRVLVLDLSDSMLLSDLSPSRLNRAKFKLQDLFAKKGLGQFGLVVFTSEPFVVSPLTDDGQTIAALLPELKPDMVPVGGYNLTTALEEARSLFINAGYNQGQILVLTATTPSAQAISLARSLGQQGFVTSIMPMLAQPNANPLYKAFANAGGGQLLRLTANSSDIDTWLDKSKSLDKAALSKEDDIPLWRDEGRWFLIPALIFLLPVFRRGWLQKVSL